jgi:hypothetical protein
LTGSFNMLFPLVVLDYLSRDKYVSKNFAAYLTVYSVR